MQQQDLVIIGIAVLALLGGFPLLRLLSAWMEDKTMDGRLVLAAIGAHLAIMATLWHTDRLVPLLIYLFLVTLAWLLMPLLNQLGDDAGMQRLRAEDMLRYQHLLAADPKNAAAQAAMADLLVENGRLEEAIAAYEKAIALDPEHAQAERRKLQHVSALRVRRRRKGGPQPTTPLPEALASESEHGAKRLVLPPLGGEQSEDLPAASPPAPTPTPTSRQDNWWEEHP